MTMRRAFLTLFLAFLFLAVSARLLFATSFSVVGGGATGLFPDDISNPGPVPYISGIGTIEVNAFSFGYVGIPGQSVAALQFSVDPGSIGANPSAVFSQATAATPEAEADIFASVFGGSNTLIFDGDGLPGPSTPLGLVEPTDDVDGYDVNQAPTLGFMWWSVDPISAPAFTIPPITAADIVVDPMPPPIPYTLPILPKIVFATGLALGLGLGDDIDALVVLEDGTAVGQPMTPGDCVLFSLAHGSTSLPAIGAGPEDVLASGPGCPDPSGAVVPWVFAAGSSLGLIQGDNIDALDIYEDPTAVNILTADAHPASLTHIFWLIILPIALLSGFIIWRHRRQNHLTFAEFYIKNRGRYR